MKEGQWKQTNSLLAKLNKDSWNDYTFNLLHRQQNAHQRLTSTRTDSRTFAVACNFDSACNWFFPPFVKILSNFHMSQLQESSCSFKNVLKPSIKSYSDQNFTFFCGNK